MKKIPRVMWIIGLLYLLAGCSPAMISPPAAASPTSPQLTGTGPIATRAQTFSQDEIASLNSLERVTEYPLYTMHYYGSYRQDVHALGKINPSLILASTWTDWGCSLFAALGDGKDMFYGRNFDWRYGPALLLFTDPPDGYASVSMVDIDYLT